MENLLVMQEIPGGVYCGVSDRIRFSETVLTHCVFLDRGRYMVETDRNAYCCRRHPEYELAVHHTDEGSKILKCPGCLKECQTAPPVGSIMGGRMVDLDAGPGPSE